MKRELRYIILKKKYVDMLPWWQRWLIHRARVWTERKLRECGSFPRACVVVESDWPEYERVWDLLEQRIIKDEAELEKLWNGNPYGNKTVGLGH